MPRLTFYVLQFIDEVMSAGVALTEPGLDLFGVLGPPLYGLGDNPLIELRREVGFEAGDLQSKRLRCVRYLR